MTSEFCKNLNIQYPLILGGLARVGTAPLAAAVSNAGGLGLLGAAYWKADELTFQIRRTRELTDKPFGVNISVRQKQSADLIDVVIKEKIPVVSTSAGNPGTYTAKLKENNIFVMHVVPTVEFSKKADAACVSAVIAEGWESGGMTSNAEISTLVLVPRVVDSVSCPVIAAGGIGDGRGLAAALSLGAVAVQMGTVFLATEECEISPAYKEMLVSAKETDTMMRRSGNTGHRTIRKEFYDEVKKRLDNQIPEIGRTLDADQGASNRSTGQVAGLIRKVVPAAALIESIINEANGILSMAADRLPPPG